jgi:CRP/FNR family transcriptional regulator, cyclic AMP receptor protein
MTPSSPEPRSPPLDLATIESLRSAGTPRDFESGSRLYEQDEPGGSILLIESGHVKIVRSRSDGHSTVLGLRGPGELVGEFASVTNGPRTASVVTLEPVRGHLIDSGTFLSLLARDPQAMLGLVISIIAKLCEADRRRVEMSGLTMKRRVARVLAEIADESCRDEAGTYTVPLSQTDLASAVDGTRESCAVAIRWLRDSGVLETHVRAIRILDLDRLWALAQTAGPRGRR